MKYFVGATVFFDPEPSGTVYAESVDGSLRIWEAENYDNPMVTTVTKAEADQIKTRPGWEGL